MKIKYLTLAFLSILVVACSDDDSTNEEPVVDLSDAKEITSFIFDNGNEQFTTTVNEDDKTITATLPTSEDVSSLVATYELSKGATINPDPKTTIDYTNPVIFTVTAEDGSTVNYTATIESTGGGNTPDQDAIVGTWYVSQYLEGGEEIYILNDCDKKTNYVFRADNYSEENYYEGDDNVGCNFGQLFGLWNKNDNGSYTVSFIEEDETYNTTFILSDGKLISEEEEDGIFYREIYVKR